VRHSLSSLILRLLVLLRSISLFVCLILILLCCLCSSSSLLAVLPWHSPVSPPVLGEVLAHLGIQIVLAPLDLRGLLCLSKKWVFGGQMCRL